MQQKSKSRSPQFGQPARMPAKSTSKSPDFPKLGEYKRNQLVQHINNKRKVQEKPTIVKVELTIEEQLEIQVREFKQEIEQKYALSQHNNIYKFPYLYQQNEGDEEEDKDISALKDVTKYTLLEQNNEAQSVKIPEKLNSLKNDIDAKFDKFDQSIWDTMQNNMQKNCEDQNFQSLRVRTEGDEITNPKLINNLTKGNKKINNYFTQITNPNQKSKTQTLYESIKEKSNIVYEKLIQKSSTTQTNQSGSNKSLGKSQSPSFLNKTLTNVVRKPHIQQLDIKGAKLRGGNKCNVLIIKKDTPESRLGGKLGKEVISPERKNQIKRLNLKNKSEILQKSPDLQKYQSAKVKQTSQIPRDLQTGRTHNYYFSNQGKAVQYESAGNKSQIKPSGKYSSRLTPNTTYNYSQRIPNNNTSRINQKGKKQNLSTESNQSDSSFKKNNIAYQEKLKELLKKQKPFHV